MREEISTSVTIVDYKLVQACGSLSHLEVLVAYQPSSNLEPLLAHTFSNQTKTDLFVFSLD